MTEFGVCYYPEQWPGERWAIDAEMMADLGLSRVRIGEFAWSSYEPRRDDFQWDWLDEAIGTLADAGLSVILGTPTATPPVWLMQERPDIIAVDSNGVRRPYGSRRHTCPTSRSYREESRRITTLLADRYGYHQAVVAWQVDNEPGNHDSARCWCEECQQAFTAWLATGYGSISDLNREWGTAFWSQTYPDFASVRLPVPTVTSHNPALLLAHRRFAARQVTEALSEQFRVLAEGSPGRDLTTNLYFGDMELDPAAVAGLGGIASFDAYPHGTSGWSETAFLIDLHRSSSSQRKAWIMEQQAGTINWTATNPPVPPGQVRAWMWQAALHGIDHLLFFRWRAAKHGQEQYHSGLLRHDGTKSRAFDEIRETITEIHGAGELSPSRPRAALLYSVEDAWAIGIDPHQAGMTHRSLLLPAYEAARSLQLDVDVVSPESDLTGYEFVIATGCHLTTPPRLAAIKAAAAAGATIVIGPRSYVKTVDDAWADDAVPSGLASAAGASVAESVNHSGNAQMSGPVIVTPAGSWTDALEVTADDTEILARYTGGTHIDGWAAATRRENYVLCGATSREAWTALLTYVVGGTAGLNRQEIFKRDGKTIAIDHEAVEITGI